MKSLLLPLCDTLHLCPDPTARQYTAQPCPHHIPQQPCRCSQGRQAKPRPSVNNQVSKPLASETSLHRAAEDLCDSPEGSCPPDGERAFPAAARPLRAAPAGGQQGRAGGPLPAASCPRGRGAAGTQRPRPRPAMDTALGGPALPCPGRRDTSGPSGAGSSLAAARRSLSPRRGARGPRAWREKSAATPERPSPRGAAGGIGPRFPGLSLRAARGDRGLQRPARPRPQVASFPCRPSEPGGGEAGRGTCTKRCWGGGRRSAGRRAPQPLPGWGCRAFPRPRCRS